MPRSYPSMTIVPHAHHQPHHHHHGSFKYPRTHLNTKQLPEREKGPETAMDSSASETESPLSATKKPAAALRKKKKKSSPKEQWPRKNKVALEGYVEAADGSDKGSESGGGIVGRTTSLSDEDLEELKGCLDLGFGFSYDEIPELCNTLPALNLCYSMSQRYLDEQRASDASSSDQDSVTSATSSSSSSSSPLVANWKISSPGDHPDEVKARLKYWAQAVACTVRLCS